MHNDFSCALLPKTRLKPTTFCVKWGGRVTFCCVNIMLILSSFRCGHMLYLLVVTDWNIREAVVVEEAHLLIEKAVDDMGPGVLPLDEAD